MLSDDILEVVGIPDTFDADEVEDSLLGFPDARLDDEHFFDAGRPQRLPRAAGNT